MRAPLLIVLSLLAVCAVSGRTARELQVTAVRFWTSSDVTRIAIEVNGDFSFKRDHLNNPDRLFFDIIDARPNVGGLRYSTRQVNDQFVKQIRIAENMPGRTRVVLDLTGSYECSVSKLENPDRLMIELRAPGGSKKKAEPRLSEPKLSEPKLSEPKPTEPKPESKPSVTSSSPSSPPSTPPAATPAPAPAPATPPPTTRSTPVIPVAVTTTTPESVAVNTPPATLPPPAVEETSTPRTLDVSPKPARDGSRSLIRALGLKINRVVIDAGHGGHDVGTTGPTGLEEKDLVLDVALRLGKLIEQRLGADVIYTRHDDTFIPLEERTEIANRSHADLFLSIHANSSPAKSVAGVETYYLNFTKSPDALDVAARENASSQKSVFELRDLIQSISMNEKIEESREFAGDIQHSMQTQLIRSFPSAKDRGTRKAPFVVLIGAQMPSVLSEIGFISNPRVEAMLKRPEQRQLIAEALYKGLSRYAESLSHIQVASQATSPVAAKPDTTATK